MTTKRQRTPQGPYFKRITGYPENPFTIGEFLRKRRLDLGLRQKAVAKIIGCNQMTVVNWEKGHTQPRINHMAGVTRFLGFNPVPKGETLAQRIANHRRAHGITQQEFAEQLGIDPSTLARWERGEREPRGQVAVTLSKRMRTVTVLYTRDSESGWQALP